MKRSILVLVCASATLLMVAGSSSQEYPHTSAGSRQSEGKSAPAPDLARMEQVVQSYVKDKQFMGAVLVARGNDVLLDKGYGFANLEWNIPDSPRTKFRLGSITKQFTAASILLLEERGKLNVEDPVKKYMPDAPAAWDKITIFNLLTHTSGIPNFTGFPDYRKLEPFSATAEELVARFRDKPLDFQPGEQWSYSNSGYVVLGYLIEKLSGDSYAHFLEDNIFKPLGMVDSGYDSNSTVIPNRASGYAPNKDGLVNAGYIDMTIPLSAGGLYSTTEDLLRWEQGLFGGKLLSPDSLKKMTTPFKNDYGLGLGIRSVNGHEEIAHGGGIEGFNTMLAYYPDDKLTVVVLANVNGSPPQEIAANLHILADGGSVVLASERPARKIDPKIFEGYLGAPRAKGATGEPKEHKQVQVNAKMLEGYVGSYQLAPNFSIAITREGDHLFEQATDQPKFEIFPESDKDYFLKAADAQITFVTDAQGRATELILHQGGADQHAKRVE
jgi:CubicO group peptidase (beta-lactamase class C family)